MLEQAQQPLRQTSQGVTLYEPGTILTLKEPKPDQTVAAKEDPDTGRKRPKHTIPFPYNRVRVIGPSPVEHGMRGGGWEGVGARGVIIEPLSGHGSTIDEPYGKLQKIYTVESIPTNEVEIAPIRVIRSTSGSAGPTPEEVFAKDSPGVPPGPGRTRGRTSPFDDVAPDDPNPSPLDG